VCLEAFELTFEPRFIDKDRVCGRACCSADIVIADGQACEGPVEVCLHCLVGVLSTRSYYQMLDGGAHVK
jgi:hypothetical protein